MLESAATTKSELFTNVGTRANDKVAETKLIAVAVGTGPPVGVGIGSLPVTPKINGEIGAMCVESGLAGVAQHNKT